MVTKIASLRALEELPAYAVIDCGEWQKSFVLGKLDLGPVSTVARALWTRIADAGAVPSGLRPVRGNRRRPVASHGSRPGWRSRRKSPHPILHAAPTLLPSSWSFRNAQQKFSSCEETHTSSARSLPCRGDQIGSRLSEAMMRWCPCSNRAPHCSARADSLVC